MQNCIFRVIENRSEFSTSLGTAFYVSGGVFITCWHVIESHSEFQRKYLPEEKKVVFDPQEIELDRGSGIPVYSVSWTQHHDERHQQNFDIAIGVPHPGEQVPDVALDVDLMKQPNQYGRLYCLGYGETDSKVLGRRSFEYTSDDASKGRFVVDSTLSPGYSGSPVFESTGKVIGVASARDIQRGCGYCLPLNRIWWWLENCVTGYPLKITTGTGLTDEQQRIQRYPLSISVLPAEAPLDMLYRIASRTYDNHKNLRIFVDQINVNISKVFDTRVDDFRYCIDPGGLSHSNIRDTWYDIFYNAWRLSGRAIGAVLETGTIFSSSYLNDSEKAVVEDLKNKIQRADGYK